MAESWEVDLMVKRGMRDIKSLMNRGYRAFKDMPEPVRIDNLIIGARNDLIRAYKKYERVTRILTERKK